MNIWISASPNAKGGQTKGGVNKGSQDIAQLAHLNGKSTDALLKNFRGNWKPENIDWGDK